MVREALVTYAEAIVAYTITRALGAVAGSTSATLAGFSSEPFSTTAAPIFAGSVAGAVIQALHAGVARGTAPSRLTDALLGAKITTSVSGVAWRVARFSLAVITGPALVANACASALRAVAGALSMASTSGGALEAAIFAFPSIFTFALKTGLAVAILGGSTSVGALLHAAVDAFP